MSFRIVGLSPEPFRHLFGLSEAELAERHVKRYLVDRRPGFPDRIELIEAKVGETVLLLNHISQPAETPYRATHAIFVRQAATTMYDEVDRVPEVMLSRLLSLRAFDNAGMMLDADVVEGAQIEPVIARLFADPAVESIHVHNARQGCYSARIERA